MRLARLMSLVLTSSKQEASSPIPSDVSHGMEKYNQVPHTRLFICADAERVPE